MAYFIPGILYRVEYLDFYYKTNEIIGMFVEDCLHVEPQKYCSIYYKFLVKNRIHLIGEDFIVKYEELA